MMSEIFESDHMNKRGLAPLLNCDGLGRGGSKLEPGGRGIQAPNVARPPVFETLLDAGYRCS